MAFSTSACSSSEVSSAYDTRERAPEAERVSFFVVVVGGSRMSSGVRSSSSSILGFFVFWLARVPPFGAFAAPRFFAVFLGGALYYPEIKETFNEVSEAIFSEEKENKQIAAPEKKTIDTSHKFEL